MGEYVSMRKERKSTHKETRAKYHESAYDGPIRISFFMMVDGTPVWR